MFTKPEYLYIHDVLWERKEVLTNRIKSGMDQTALDNIFAKINLCNSIIDKSRNAR